MLEGFALGCGRVVSAFLKDLPAIEGRKYITDGADELDVARAERAEMMPVEELGSLGPVSDADGDDTTEDHDHGA